MIAKQNCKLISHVTIPSTEVNTSLTIQGDVAVKFQEIRYRVFLSSISSNDYPLAQPDSLPPFSPIENTGLLAIGAVFPFNSDILPVIHYSIHFEITTGKY